VPFSVNLQKKLMETGIKKQFIGIAAYHPTPLWRRIIGE
jgi:hypothetical protein